jgi:hypothetical protein
MPREHPARDESPQSPGESAPPRAKLPIAILLAALAAGGLMGSFEIANTSIGWHLASGRLILEQRAIPQADPFSLTAGGTPWLDHEWLFQVAAALADGLAGAPALVALRALAVAALAALLLAVGLRSGLSPPAALLLALLCVAGARPRFFVRPELVTLLVVPACASLYLTRRERRPAIWAGCLAGLMVVGVNAHGGALLVPFLLAGLLAAETAQSLLGRRIDRGALGSGVAGVTVAALAVLANPAGWRLYAVPFELAQLVGRPHVTNPEWFPPSFAEVPQLFVALAAALVVMGLRERSLVRWALLGMAGALALRHVRHLGLLFVLLPLAAAPALASWRALAREEDEASTPARRARGLALVAAGVLALALAVAPQPRFGFSYAAGFYPAAACDFLDREGLPREELYNDVRFGGYLIDRYWPARRVFQDDRNEIHEPLLREIWEIFARSDVAAFTQLLERHRCDTALVRYHPPWRVAGPDGESSGMRGFSALWFPSIEWALVYWDDVAMVFVRREGADPSLLERSEYRLLRPDDFDFVAARITADPERRMRALAEAQRALRTSPDSGRAAAILARLALDPAGPVTGR